MLMLFNNLFALAALFLASLCIFKFCLRGNKLLANTICIFLSLQVILVAFIMVEQHRFKLNLANSIFMDDGECYSYNAWQISTALTGVIPGLQSISQMRGIHLTRAGGLEKYYYDYVKEKIIPPPSEYQIGYITYLYSLIYAAYGFTPALINFMNVILHLLTAILIYKSVSLIFDNRAAYLSSVFFLLNPISFYYSSTKLQESMFIFIVYLSVYCFIMTMKKGNLWYAFLILFLLYISHSLLKTYYFVPLLLAFMVSSVIVLFKKKKMVFFILVAFVIVYLVSAHANVFAKIKSYSYQSLDFMVIRQQGFYNTGGQVYQLFIPGKDIHDYALMDWVTYFLKGWYHVLGEPVLSSRTPFSLILFFPIKIVFLILCALAVPGFLMAMRYGHIEAVIFFNIFLLVGSGLAMASGNIGTMFRHRDLIVPIVFVFSSFYITRFYYRRDLNDMRKG